MDKYVCGKCFDDEFIQDFISANAVSKECSYCGNVSDEEVAADIRDVADFIKDGLESEFDYAVCCLPYETKEGGYQGVTYDTHELLRDYAELGVEDDTLFNDLLALFPDELWCDRDPFRLSRDEELRFDWRRFSDLVKHETRYVFFRMGTDDDRSSEGKEKNQLYTILYDIAKLVDEWGLRIEVPEGTRVYRARVHASDRFSNVADLGPPPKERAVYANRFSPAGIVMFYGALDADTAIAEVYDRPKKPKRVASIGVFEALQSLRFLDFANLPSCPGIFNGQTRDERAPLRFLNAFVRDCTQSITKDGREHIEYVPTQIVTEFFRHVLTDEDGHHIDGFFYPSSKRQGGICCVVFCSSDACTENQQSLTVWGMNRDAVLSLDTQTVVYVELP